MKENKISFAVALILIVFFMSQFTAEIFYLATPKPEPGKKFHKPSLDLKLLSLSSRLLTESAFAQIEAGTSSSSEMAVKANMMLLRQALMRNPLDYQARYYLAKTYLQFSNIDNDYFDLGVRELKRAARIRGNNKNIALDCGLVFFSLWPLLEDNDKAFAAKLLAAAMPSLSWPEFKPLLELWSLYVQDTSLLMELLKGKPLFFGPVADQLLLSAIPIEQRREFLVLYEIYILDSTERRFNALGLQGEINLDRIQSLLDQQRKIKGYYRFKPDCGFDPEKLARFQSVLLLDMITGLLADTQVEADPLKVRKLREYIMTYIADHSGLKDINELDNILTENEYFKNNDFSSLYLKTLIAHKKGGYGDIIAEIEALRKTISFVKKEQLADYTNILLLLIDSYYSSKLLTAAESVARELYESQPDNPDILYRVLRIQKILGDEGAPDRVLNEKLAAVENSRFLTMAKANSSFDIFLFNQPEIEIVFDPVWLATLKPKQLLQVFVDNKIAFESYVDGLPEKIVIGPPFTEAERKVRVQVIVI